MKLLIDKLGYREKRVLYLGGALLLGAIFYWAVLQPFFSELYSYRADVPAKQEQLRRMNVAAKEVELLRGGRTAQINSDNLLSMLNSSAETYNLRNHIKRLEPDSRNKVRVWLEYASYNDLIKWVYYIENSGVNVVNFAAERLESPGVVNARLQLQINSVK